MKLVYLYIEKYKNIENQGFNFSPEFDCKFENGILTIDKNDKFRNSIFPDNINVTAIVGKNGSGKSSVFEFLFKLNKNTTYKYIVLLKNSNKDLYLYNNINIDLNSSLDIKSAEKINNLYYINISHFFDTNILESNNYIHLYKDFSYPLDEKDSYNLF